MMDQGNSAGSPAPEKVTPASENAAPSHTPTPWGYGRTGPEQVMIVGGENRAYVCSVQITQTGGGWVARAMEPERVAKAALIVRAVNAHDDLIEHLRTSTTMLEALLTQLHAWGHESAVNASGQVWKNEELLASIEGAV